MPSIILSSSFMQLSNFKSHQVRTLNISEWCNACCIVWVFVRFARQFWRAYLAWTLSTLRMHSARCALWQPASRGLSEIIFGSEREEKKHFYNDTFVVGRHSRFIIRKNSLLNWMNIITRVISIFWTAYLLYTHTNSRKPFHSYKAHCNNNIEWCLDI